MGKATVRVLVEGGYAMDDNDLDDIRIIEYCRVIGEVVKNGQVLHKIQVITTVLYADEVRVAADDVMCKIKEWAMQNTDYSPLEKRSYLERIREWLSPAHT